MVRAEFGQAEEFLQVPRIMPRRHALNISLIVLRCRLFWRVFFWRDACRC